MTVATDLARRTRPARTAGRAQASDAAGLIEALAVPAALIDADGRICLMNAPMRARARPGARGTTYADLFPADSEALGGHLDGEREASLVRPTLTGQAAERLVLRRHAGGTLVTVVADAMSAGLSDVAAVQATRLASLGFMVAGVCHEVGNPLAAIHSMLQILRSRPDHTPEMIERGLASISANVARVLSITRVLTDFSRVGEDPARPVRIAQAVEDALALFGCQCDAQKLAIVSSIDPSAAVAARAGQLERVVLNLLLNAAQAMGGSGRIEITLAIEGERGRLSVRDQGPGIPEPHLARVFEAFFSTKPPGTGAGLGLAISREIVHELGGALGAVNHPGGGASFSIDLPLAEHVAR